MKVLMLSIDKGLLGQGQLGDVVQRHKKYGEFCDKLDIIVLSKKGYKINKISEKVIAYSTNSCCKLAYYFNALKISKRLFQQNKYDLIVCQEPFLTGLVGYKLKKKYKAKLLVHFHGDFRMPIQKVIKNADGIRVMSAGQKERLVQKGVDKNKIRIISTPVDIDYFLNYQGNKFHDTKNILFVGRLESVKNLDWFLDVFEDIKNRYKNVKFVIIGKGSQENNLKFKASDSVEFLGHLAQEEIIKYYYNSDIIVLSSKSESFGKVLVEANACAKPVVSTATTGAKEIIQDGYNGFLVPIGDVEKMAEKILYLLNNPEKAKEMGQNGRKLVKEKYSHSTEEMVKFWQDLTEK